MSKTSQIHHRINELLDTIPLSEILIVMADLLEENDAPENAEVLREASTQVNDNEDGSERFI